MSWVWRLAALIVVAGVAVWIGASLYNAGVTAGLAEAARQAAATGDGAPIPPAYAWGNPYWGGPMAFGFGPLALFFWTFLGIFLVIGLVRFAVGERRWDGPGPNGWRGRRLGAEEWHRELHRRDAGEGPPQAAGA
jgi:hypothetical protein